ncbi:MAG TPA: ABC transporter permease [Candidatus Acidoferrales bacterium]|nr:ABC transporter permease [Candidatus Acidoferrales bacterium]
MSEENSSNLKPLKDVYIIATMKAIPDIKRQPLTLIIITFLSFIPLFFTYFFGGQNYDNALVGGMVGSIGFIGLASAVQDITWDRYVKIREMIVAMPVHPLSYSVGVALSKLLYASPGFIIFVVISTVFRILPLSSLGWVVAAVFLCWAALSSIGFVMSTYLRNANINTLNNVSNILGILFIFLPPVFYSEQVWGSYHWLAIIFPTSNAAGLIKSYAGIALLTSEVVLLRWLVLIITTVVSLLLVALKSRWREE